MARRWSGSQPGIRRAFALPRGTSYPNLTVHTARPAYRPRMNPRPVAAFLLCAALTGCGTSGSADTKPRPAPSPTGDPHAYAREITGPAADAKKAYTNWQRVCDEGIEPACSIGALNFATTVKTVSITADGVLSPKSTVYVGGKLTGDAGRLAEETSRDAAELAAVAEKYARAEPSCTTPLNGNPACITWKGDMDRLWALLQADLAKWERF
jgi:hypothetical protein